MSKKSLLLLSAVTIVIIIAATLSTGNRAPTTAIEKPLLIPELKDSINNIAQIIIESPDEAVHILKVDEGWGVMQADNYPARFDKVKKLVIDIAELYVIADKTSKPEYFAELGVEDINAENARSHKVTFRDASGNTMASLILGNRTDSSELYVRPAESNNSYLAGGNPELTTEVREWIVRDLVDIADDRIKATVINHPDGETLTLERQQGEEDFTLVTVPAGRTVRSAYFTNQPATFLSELDIQNAVKRGNFTFPDTPVLTTFKTYDGLMVSVNTAKVGGQNYASLEFSVDETSLDISSDEEETIVIGETAGEPVDVRREVEDLNNRIGAWVFIIPQSKYLLLTKRIEELTDTEETAGEE